MLDAAEIETIGEKIIAAIKTVYDPEIPVDIYELGLIYKIDLSEEGDLDIVFTVTAPGCPVAHEIPIWIENAVSPVEGVRSVKTELTFEPPWDPSRMSEVARMALNMY